MKLLSAPLFLSIAAAATLRSQRLHNTIQARGDTEDTFIGVLSSITAQFYTLAAQIPDDWVNGTVTVSEVLSKTHVPNLANYDCTYDTTERVATLANAIKIVSDELKTTVSLTNNVPTNQFGLPTSCSEARSDLQNMVGNFNHLMAGMNLALNGDTTCKSVADDLIGLVNTLNDGFHKFQGVTC